MTGPFRKILGRAIEEMRKDPVIPHRCPRRVELSDRQNEAFPGPDEYRDGRGLVNSFAPGCTHCGSISGDAFMEFVRAGGKVGGTDKNYKAYLSKDTGTPHESEEYDAYVHPVTGEMVKGTKTKQGTGVQTAKFYYQHLSIEQRREFVELWNEGKVNHSIYVWPFFMVEA